MFLQARHKLFHWFTRCERQFGFETFEISVPSLPPGVVINDPKNLDYVLKNDDLFNKGEFFRRRSWDLFGTWAETDLRPRIVCRMADVLELDVHRQWDHQCRWTALEGPT